MKNNKKFNKLTNLLPVTFFVGFFALIYVYQFDELLKNGQTEGLGFIGIIQSDAINYLNIYRQENIYEYLDANVRNTFYPAMVWSILDGNWYFATVFNIVLLYFTGRYLEEIARDLDVCISKSNIYILFLLPETFMYLIGVLKEIPSLFLVTASTYYFLRKRYLIYIVICILMISIRFQFLIGIVIFFTSYYVFKRQALGFMFILSAILACLYPFLVNNIPELGLDNAMLYRELSAGLGIGELIEHTQFNYYFISIFATMAKFIQAILEPWPNITSIVVDGSLNILSLSYALTAIIMIIVWLRYFKFLYFIVCKRKDIKREIYLVSCISFSFLMLPIFNSFVHHRYLFPMIGLILLLTSIKKNSILINKY